MKKRKRIIHLKIDVTKEEDILIFVEKIMKISEKAIVKSFIIKDELKEIYYDSRRN